MSSPQVRLKKSAVTGKAPLLDDLSLGELAINYYDGSLYTKQDTGGVGIATTITNLTPWQETYGGGSLSYTGDINLTGNLAVDASTLFVNATNNRIGIGTDNPAYQVEIENTGANALLVLDRTDGASTFIEGGGTASVLGSVGANDVKIAYNSVPVVTIGSGGDVTTSGDITGGTLRADNFTTENAFAIVGSDNNLIQNTTLSVDPASNYLGINQTSPEVTLHMTGEGAQTAQIRMEQYNDSADAPDLRTRRYRGTAASPSAVQAGDYLYRSNHEYYNGTSLLVGGAFAFDNTNNANRTQFSVAVDVDGTGANPQGNNGQFKIDGNDNGAITFNNAYKFPTSDGSANQVLKTDGNGQLSFSDNVAGPGVTTSNSTNRVGIDSFQASTFQSAIYNVQAVRGVDVDLTTISLIHNGSQTYQTEYATVRTGGQIATYSSEYESGVIQFYAHPVSSTSTTFKVDRTLI